MKDSGLVVHNFEPLPEWEETAMVSSLLDRTSDMVDAHPDLTGYLLIAFTPDNASIVLNYEEGIPAHMFFAQAKHILDNYDRYAAADQETS
jgi:hypothetical protein